MSARHMRWARPVARVTLWLLVSYGATGLPAFLLSMVTTGDRPPDPWELPVHSDCGSLYSEESGQLVTCSDTYGRVQVYSRSEGFQGGAFVRFLDPFTISVGQGGEVQVFEGGQSRALSLRIGPSRTERWNEDRPEPFHGWEPVVVRESRGQLVARARDTDRIVLVVRKKALLSRSPSPSWSLLALLGGSMLLVLERRLVS